MEKILEHLEILKNNNIPIIVEGKKDKAALKKLGLSNIFAFYDKPMYKLVETICEKAKSVVILTDLDKEGKRIYSKLNHEFCQRGVHVDNEFRHFLFKETKLRQIEGLRRYILRNLDSEGL